MKEILTIILLLLTIVGIPVRAHAQNFTISNDSAKKSMDVSGQFNGAEVQLPAVNKQPEF